MGLTGTTERPPLSSRARVLVGTGLVLVLALVVAIPLAVRAKRLEDEARRRTNVLLVQLRELPDFKFRQRTAWAGLLGVYEGVGCDLMDAPDGDATGQADLLREFSSGAWLAFETDAEWTLRYDGKALPVNETCKRVLMPHQSADGSPDRQGVLDAWGNPIRYRRPGPVHRNGWDLYSVGPNGVDEQGEGDDLVVGEDVAPVGSRR